MLKSIKQRLGHDDEQGFTLIELMVVVLIIAILLAIAIPTFLGARNSANARAAQSNLRNALTAEQTQWTNGQAFSTASATMKLIEPAINWVDNTAGGVTVTATSPPNSVLGTPSDTAATPQIVVLTALGKDGNCWSILQVNDPVDTTIEGTSYNKAAPVAGACGGTIAPIITLAATAGSAGSNAAGAVWYTSF
jgi:type IV pilus assembly protein PilA